MGDPPQDPSHKSILTSVPTDPIAVGITYQRNI